MPSKGKLRRQESSYAAGGGAAPGIDKRAWLFPFVLGVVLSGGIVLLAKPSSQSIADAAARASSTQARLTSELPSLGDLAGMSGEQIEQQDLALLNLRCAEGLPGAEQLDVGQCLATLDRWAARVKHETQLHLYKYAERPDEYENSEGYFRMLMLITVLQQDFKVHYNPERIREVDFRRSRDLFIHGMIDSDNGGTCVSMPALYAAVARRLGYPVFLVTAKEHVFCRWDDGNERFNVEATAQGMSNFDDAYYMKWPKPISEAEVKSGDYLKSLSVAESLATFLAARGHCLEDNGRIALARVSYAQAAALSPRPIFQGFLVQSMGFRQSLPWQQATAKGRTIKPPNVYQRNPYAERPPATDFRTPSNSAGYFPYHASKPPVHNVEGLPNVTAGGISNPLPGYGVQP